MNKRGILEKAIQQAITGGWKTGIPSRIRTMRWFEGEFSCGWQEYGDEVESTDFIFNHDFAKALWGEEPIHDTIYKTDDRVSIADEGLPVYKFHLMRMVAAPDPIKYLGEHLDS